MHGISAKRNFSPFPNSVGRSWFVRYAIALLCVALAVAIRWLLEPWLFNYYPFLTLYGAVAIAVWFGGWRPAVLTAFVGFVISNFLFVAPRYHLVLSEAYVWAGFAGYSLSCGLIIYLGEAMRRARHRAEQQKELLATTLTSIGDAVIVTDEAGFVTSLNAEAEHLTGWPTVEAAGKPLAEVFPILNERTRQSVENPVDKVLRLGTVTGLANHTILVSRDGREIPIDDSAAPIRYADGPILGVVLVFRDVTEQRRAQEERARLAEIVKYSGDAIFTKDINGIINSWNDSAQRLFGYDAEEIVGKPATVLFPAERLHEEDHILERLRQGQASERLETIRVRKDGKPIHVSVSVSPLRNSDGEIIGASKIIHDVSALVAAREELVREKELLATTLASIGDGVILTDAAGRVTYLNRQAQRLTGWTSAEAQSRPLHEVFRIINEQTRETVENPVEKVMRLGGVVGLANHTVLIAKDGREIPIDDSAAPIRQAGGPLFGVVLVFRDFTERKRVEEALRQSELQKTADLIAMTWLRDVGELCASDASVDECLQAIVGAAIAITDAGKGNLQLLDPGTNSLTIAAQQGFAEPFLDFFREVTMDDPASCGAAMTQHQRMVVDDITQSEIFAGQPSLRVLLDAGVRAVQSTPLISSTGRLLGMISTHFAEPHRPTQRGLSQLDLLARQAADYLERRQDQQALREREERFRTMADGAPVMIWLSGTDKLCTWFNRQWLEFTGRTMEQELGNGWAEGVHADDFDRCLKTYVESFDAREPFAMEYRLKRHDGEWRWVLDHGVPIYASEIFTGYIGSCIDVTERKRTEQELQENQARLTGLIDSAMDAVIAVNSDHRIVLFNPAAEQMFGCGASEVMGESLDRFIPAAVRAAHRQHIADFGRTGATTRRMGALGALSGVRAGGDEFPIEASISHLNTDGQKLFTVILRDITERKNLEEQREQLLAGEQELRHQAEEANRLKDEFLAIMSHELRNPLNVILGYSELLLLNQEIAQSPQLHHMAAAVKRNAVAQSKLIRDLLDLSRLRSGKLELNKEVVSVLGAIENAIDSVRSDADAKGISLGLVFPEDALFVEADPVRLEQIIWNLLNNSVKFTPPQGAITIALAHENGNLSLIVSDTGEGIDQSFLPHVFEMFRQADGSTSRTQTGMGVGLAVVQQLTELHGGSITAHSAGLGKGATFTLTLPLTTKLKPATTVGATDLAGHALTNMTVLVVDDSEDTAEMLKELLAMSGATVVAATSGADALRLVADKEFDVILSDISMPGMDGFEFLRRLNQIPRNKGVPVLALTGFGRPEDIERAQREGFFSHITKPFDLNVLLDVLQRVPQKKVRAT